MFGIVTFKTSLFKGSQTILHKSNEVWDLETQGKVKGVNSNEKGFKKKELTLSSIYRLILLCPDKLDPPTNSPHRTSTHPLHHMLLAFLFPHFSLSSQHSLCNDNNILSSFFQLLPWFSLVDDTGNWVWVWFVVLSVRASAAWNDFSSFYFVLSFHFLVTSWFNRWNRGTIIYRLPVC